MSYTARQHIDNRIASAYGYKIQEGINLSEFSVGEGIIILSRKGEPLMSGLIDAIESENGGMRVSVGEEWWNDTEYMFRRM
jgi:hypothetical protein